MLRLSSCPILTAAVAAVVPIVTPPVPVVEPEAMEMVAPLIVQLGTSVAPVGVVATVQLLRVMVPA